MHAWLLPFPLLLAAFAVAADPGPPLVAKPDAFKTLVNPDCSHCKDEAKRRAGELRDDDRVLCWVRDTKGHYDGGAMPIRFFLNTYRVISDSYGVFVYDPDAGFARGFAPSYDFTFHGWRNGVMVMRHKDGTLYSCLTGVAFDGPKKGTRLKPVPTIVSDWGFWLKHYPDSVAYHMFDKYKPVELPKEINDDSKKSRLARRRPPARRPAGAGRGRRQGGEGLPAGRRGEGRPDRGPDRRRPVRHPLGSGDEDGGRLSPGRLAAKKRTASRER